MHSFDDGVWLPVVEVTAQALDGTRWAVPKAALVDGI